MIAVYYLLTILCTILLLASVISSISCLTDFNRFCLKWCHFFICRGSYPCGFTGFRTYECYEHSWLVCCKSYHVELSLLISVMLAYEFDLRRWGVLGETVSVKRSKQQPESWRNVDFCATLERFRVCDLDDNSCRMKVSETDGGCWQAGRKRRSASVGRMCQW